MTGLWGRRRTMGTVIVAAIVFTCGIGSAPTADTITARKLLENLESDNFQGQFVDIEFDGADLQTVFRRMQDLSGLTFIVRVERKPDGRTYRMLHIRWDRALDTILQDYHLVLVREGDALAVLDRDAPAAHPFLYFWLPVLATGVILIAAALVILRVRSRRTNKAPRKYTMTDENARGIEQKLLELLNEKQVYRDENLSLRALARLLHIPPYQLSWLINERLGKTFFELINGCRVEDVKKQLLDSRNADTPLFTIAMRCGFGTKAVFNRVFKQLTGLTPTQFKSGRES